MDLDAYTSLILPPASTVLYFPSNTELLAIIDSTAAKNALGEGKLLEWSATIAGTRIRLALLQEGGVCCVSGRIVVVSQEHRDTMLEKMF